MEIKDLASPKPFIAPSMDRVKQLVRDDLIALDHLILQSLHTEVSLIQEIARHIISSGGKRLRPLLTLLSTHLFGYQGNDHIPSAAVIEFIHTATLLHDDVVDDSSLRRGQKTANAIWGNPSSVLVGDFLYSRSFQMLINLKNLEIMDLLAQTTSFIAEGEVQQLLYRHNPDVTEAQYMQVIRAKTAVLFSAACQLGAIISKQPLHQQHTISHFGLHLGIAFQLIDDLLDYTASREVMGKNIGDDLAEGKTTLPLIFALQQSSRKDVELIRTAITKGGLENLDPILDILHETGAFNYVKEQAMHHMRLAKDYLGRLPDNEYHQALAELSHLAVHRQY